MENRTMRLRTVTDIPSDAVIENYRPALNTQTKAGQEHQYLEVVQPQVQPSNHPLLQLKEALIDPLSPLQHHLLWQKETQSSRRAKILFDAAAHQLEYEQIKQQELCFQLQNFWLLQLFP